MILVNLFSKVVDLILDPRLSREELVSEILDSLRDLRKRLDERSIDVEEFEILKVCGAGEAPLRIWFNQWKVGKPENF